MSAPQLPQPVTQQDVDILARTLYGEARGEPLAGQIAVAHVIVNRARAMKWYGKKTHHPDHSISAICQRRWQFSCWNEGDPNRRNIESLTLNDQVFRRCMFVALGVLIGAAGYTDDPTNGSDHYHAAGAEPDWAEDREPVVTIGRHHFYNDVP